MGRSVLLVFLWIISASTGLLAQDISSLQLGDTIRVTAAECFQTETRVVGVYQQFEQEKVWMGTEDEGSVGCPLSSAEKIELRTKGERAEWVFGGLAAGGFTYLILKVAKNNTPEDEETVSDSFIREFSLIPAAIGVIGGLLFSGPGWKKIDPLPPTSITLMPSGRVFFGISLPTRR